MASTENETAWEVKNNQLLLRCIIQPNASRDELIGLYNSRFKIRLKTPPNEGRANKQLIQFLAKLLKIPRSNITLLKGSQSRQKTLSISGFDQFPQILAKHLTNQAMP